MTLAWNRARELALWRYDRKCAQCGRSASLLELAGERLEVDHIDNDATNHAQSNLEPLCPGCHASLRLRGAHRDPAGDRTDLQPIVKEDQS